MVQMSKHPFSLYRVFVAVLIHLRKEGYTPGVSTLTTEDGSCEVWPTSFSSAGSYVAERQ